MRCRCNEFNGSDTLTYIEKYQSLDGSIVLRLVKDREIDEYQVRWYKDGKFDDMKSYYAMGKEDAYNAFDYMKGKIEERLPGYFGCPC